MLATGFCLALLQITVPGAKEVAPVVNERLTTAPLFFKYQGTSVPRHRMLSEDGHIAFVYDGKMHRVPLMRKGGPIGGEALFLMVRDNENFSWTTSQAAHARASDAHRLDRVGNMRLLLSLDGGQVLTATNLENDSIRLTLVNLDARGDRPNRDFQVPGIKAEEGAAVMAKLADGVPTWFVTRVKSDSQTLIYRFVRAGAALTGELAGKAPMSLQLMSFDPNADLAITDQSNRTFWVVNTDTGVGAEIEPTTYGYPFLSRGEVFFADDDRIYRVNKGNRLEVFCDYRLLATSASGNYWVALDKGGKAWRFKF